MPIISGADLTCSPCGRRAKAARKWFAEHGPADLQPLPLGYDEREALKDTSAAHIVALYARSLAELKYDVQKHPSFYDYACGTMASEFQGLDSMKKNPELLSRFPPRHLDGLGPGLYWDPPLQPKSVRLCRPAKGTRGGKVARIVETRLGTIGS